MILQDTLYGTFEIQEPVLLDLLHSKPIQRLKGIAQYGLPAEYYHHQGFSRYEHCVGVMLLLRKLGASLNEQIAGLLHDASHTAFSHIADWVLGRKGTEDYQDIHHERILQRFGIPAILTKHKISFEEILHKDRYTLLEQPVPALCADRVDYALREFVDWANPDIVASCASSLQNSHGKIVFSSRETARSFGETYLKCQTEHWGGAEAVIRYTLLSDALLLGLEQNIITSEDFYQDDEFMLEKLWKSSDAPIQRTLTRLHGKLEYVEDSVNPSIVSRKKFRYVDPEFLDNGLVRKLSEVDPDYPALIQRHREINEKGIRVVVVD